MKYTFICAVHFLELDTTDLSINLASGIISNNKDKLNQIFNNDLSLNTLGLHSIDEILEAPSYYIVEGDLGDNITQEDVNQYGTNLCFCLLRQIQKFTADLWTLRDNSIYVRDGFLYTYAKYPSDGYTFKASVSAVNSFSTGDIRNIIIPTNALISIGESMEVFEYNSDSNNSQDFKKPTQIQHYKNSGLSRKDLAECYIAMARANGVVPQKLLMYSAALESLVATSTTELSHRVSERVAILLGKTTEERCAIYSDKKNGYDTRSKVAHGDMIKKDENFISNLSQKIDEYLRKLLKLEAPFNLSNGEIDKYFLSLLMA